MPRIYVEFAKLKSLGDSCKTVSSKVDGIKTDFERTVSQLDWDVKYMSDINNTAKQLAAKIGRYTTALRAYQTFILDAYAKYQKLDAEKFEIGNTSSGGSPVLDFLWNSLKKAGYFGSVISVADGFSKLINPADWGTAIVTAGKAGLTVIDKIAGLIKDANNIGKVTRMVGTDNATAMWAKRIFGTTESLKYYSKAASWGDKFSYDFGKALDKGLGAFTGKAGALKATTAWAGVALSGVVNFFSNQKEMETEGISQGRAWAETITETGIDVVKGLAVGAAVTAGIAATFGSAPVLAVAAVSIGVTMGADAISKHFTGKGVTELVSDAVLDTSVTIYNAVKDTANKAVNCFNNVTNAFSSWGKAFGF